MKDFDARLAELECRAVSALSNPAKGNYVTDEEDEFVDFCRDNASFILELIARVRTSTESQRECERLRGLVESITATIHPRVSYSVNCEVKELITKSMASRQTGGQKGEE